jgi:GH15 family glucan-1,4-alpha-glucosidase
MLKAKLLLFFTYWWYVILKHTSVLLDLDDKRWERDGSGKIITHSEYNPWLGFVCDCPLRHALDDHSENHAYCPKCKCITDNILEQFFVEEEQIVKSLVDSATDEDEIRNLVESAIPEYLKLKKNNPVTH